MPMTEFSTLYPRRINLLKGIQNFIKKGRSFAGSIIFNGSNKKR